jgi:hypothetical protein
MPPVKYSNSIVNYRLEGVKHVCGFKKRLRPQGGFALFLKTTNMPTIFTIPNRIKKEETRCHF